MSYADQAERTATAHPVQLVANRADGGVTGLTVVVAIRLGSTVTTPEWLDFDDNTFKTGGWTTRQATLTEVSAADAPGIYALAGGLDINGMIGLPADERHLVVEFEVTAGGASGEQMDIIILKDSVDNDPNEFADVVWDEDVVAAHGTADTAGRLLRALGAAIARRNFNNDLEALLSVVDEPYETLIDAIWDELRDLHNIPGSFGEGVNVMELDFIREALQDLAAAAVTMVQGAVDTTAFAPTTTKFESTITEATPDHFNGRAIIFRSGALKDQAIAIDDIGGYLNVGGRGRFTVSRDGKGNGPLTEAPADGDLFIIV